MLFYALLDYFRLFWEGGTGTKLNLTELATSCFSLNSNSALQTQQGKLCFSVKLGVGYERSNSNGPQFYFQLAPIVLTGAPCSSFNREEKRSLATCVISRDRH